MTHDTVIHTDGLTRRFGTVTAVDSLNLHIERGEVFGFLGHNGAGKTTTVRLLNGVLAADAGRALVLGLSAAEDGPAIRARTGVLTETPSLDERLTGQENLAIYAQLYSVPRAEIAGRVDALLTTFDLAERGDDKVGGYSKGMKQRLALARALLHRPELLFLDEPTSGLDPVSQRQVHELVLRHSRDEGQTVFLTTHNLEEAGRLCHRVAVMERGRMVAIGTPAELAQQVGMRSHYTLEIAPPDMALARQKLAAIDGIDVKQANTNNLIVSTREREQVPDMLSHLVTAGVRVYALAPQEASLEDIYFALHADSQQTTGGASA